MNPTLAAGIIWKDDSGMRSNSAIKANLWSEHMVYAEALG